MSSNCNIASAAASIIPNNSGNNANGNGNGANNQANALPAAKRRGLNAIVIPTCTAQTPITADLASLFECPVCFDYVLPPILQCQSGHLVCSNCRPKLTGCPTCRGPLGNIRNLAMEKVASTIMFPCKYSSSGCSLSLLHTEKVEHEEMCEWRPYTCPCPGASCKWQGGLEQVMAHLMMSHKSITTLQGEDIVFLATDINLPGAVDWVMMQSCFGYNFMLVLEKQEKFEGHQQFFAIVQLIGSRKQAENFAYRLELNGPRRRLTWEATPRSIHEGVATAIMNSDCLVFDISMAQLFSDNEFKYCITIETMSMCHITLKDMKEVMQENREDSDDQSLPDSPQSFGSDHSEGICQDSAGILVEPWLIPPGEIDAILNTEVTEIIYERFINYLSGILNIFVTLPIRPSIARLSFRNLATHLKIPSTRMMEWGLL